MSDAPSELKRICWSEVFGFVRVFRSFKGARQPLPLLLTFLAVVCTYLVGRALDGLWPAQSMPVVTADTTELARFIASSGDRDAVGQWIASLGDAGGLDRRGVFSLMLAHARGTANRLVGAVFSTSPGGIVAAVSHGFIGVGWVASMHPAYALLFGALGLAIWAYFGGAACRCIALYVTRDEHLTLAEATRFSCSKFWAFFFAPILPLAFVLVIGLFLALGGFLGLIPILGDVLAGILFFLAIALGLAVALILIGLVAGWGMTFPTIAVESSDPFDVFSRIGSYVYYRPFRLLLYLLCALVHGALCIFFLKLVARLTFWAAGTFTGVSMNLADAYVADADASDAPMLRSVWQAPSPIGGGSFYGDFDGPALAHVSRFTRFCLRGWVYGVWALVAAFAVNYFFTANTIIYLLLRREVDATDLEDVVTEDSLGEPQFAAETDTGTPPSGGGGTSLPVVGQG